MFICCMKQRLTVEEKRDILRKVNVEKKGVSDVAREYDRTIRTIYKIVNGETKQGKNRRQTKANDDTKDRIVRLVMSNKNISMRDIHERLGLHVSYKTINEYLTDEGFCCSGTKKPSRVRCEVEEEETIYL